MSYNLQPKSVFDALSFLNGDATIPLASESSWQRAAEERAVDCALRNVPLPEGLLTRLGKLIYTLPDSSTDQTDCLGC